MSIERGETSIMMRKLLSTGIGLLVTLAVFFPVNYSLVNASNMSSVLTDQRGTCIKVQADGTKVNICGFVDPLDVSWNSGGG